MDFSCEAKAALGDAATPHCNVNNYLVGANGSLVAASSTRVEPLDPKPVRAVEGELAKVRK